MLYACGHSCKNIFWHVCSATASEQIEQLTRARSLLHERLWSSIDARIMGPPRSEHRMQTTAMTGLHSAFDLDCFWCRRVPCTFSLHFVCFKLQLSSHLTRAHAHKAVKSRSYRPREQYGHQWLLLLLVCRACVGLWRLAPKRGGLRGQRWHSLSSAWRSTGHPVRKNPLHIYFDDIV